MLCSSRRIGGSLSSRCRNRKWRGGSWRSCSSRGSKPAFLRFGCRTVFRGRKAAATGFWNRGLRSPQSGPRSLSGQSESRHPHAPPGSFLHHWRRLQSRAPDLAPRFLRVWPSQPFAGKCTGKQLSRPPNDKSPKRTSWLFRHYRARIKYWSLVRPWKSRPLVRRGSPRTPPHGGPDTPKSALSYRPWSRPSRPSLLNKEVWSLARSFYRPSRSVLRFPSYRQWPSTSWYGFS